MLQLLDPLAGQLELPGRSLLCFLDKCVNHDDALAALEAMLDAACVLLSTGRLQVFPYPAAVCQYGAGCFAQDAFGGAADQQAFQTGQAHGAHNDQTNVIHAKPIARTSRAGGLFILDDPFFQGLALSLIFGILVSTVLTLLVIPLFYYAWLARKPASGKQAA